MLKESAVTGFPQNYKITQRKKINQLGRMMMMITYCCYI